MLAVELAYNTTSHSPNELSPFEDIIGAIPLTAAGLDVAGALPSTPTRHMTNLFWELCDRAHSLYSAGKVDPENLHGFL